MISEEERQKQEHKPLYGMSKEEVQKRDQDSQKREQERLERNKKGFEKIWFITVTILLLGVISGLLEWFSNTAFYVRSTGAEWLLFGIFVVLIFILFAVISKK